MESSSSHGSDLTKEWLSLTINKGTRRYIKCTMLEEEGVAVSCSAYKGVVVILKFCTYTLQRRSDWCIPRNETAQPRSSFQIHVFVSKRGGQIVGITKIAHSVFAVQKKFLVTTVYFYRRTYKYFIYKGGRGPKLYSYVYGMQSSKPVPSCQCNGDIILSKLTFGLLVVRRSKEFLSIKI